MQNIPRIAVGNLQPHADARPATWALLSLLTQAGLQVQSFLSQSRFASHRGSAVATGNDQRHLDNWVMPPAICQRIFSDGAQSCDLAVIEGDFGANDCGGGCLDTLCEWLSAPRVLIVNASQSGLCRLPRRTCKVDAVIIDEARSAGEAYSLGATLNATWRVPMLGWMPESSVLRRLIQSLPAGSAPTADLCEALAARLADRLNIDVLLALAAEAPAVEFPMAPVRGRRSIQVAAAFDEAFPCYFPDTFDQLESRGATIRTFSPLVSDRVPEDADIIYLGCGRIEQFATALAGNHCLIQSLRSHVSRGGRVYAEGAGVAFLCQEIQLPNGCAMPMSGLIPSRASWNADAARPRPTEVRIGADCWLGPAQSRFRGYLNDPWTIRPCGSGSEIGGFGSPYWFAHKNVLGSQVPLNFAAHPAYLDRFFRPHATARVAAAT